MTQSEGKREKGRGKGKRKEKDKAGRERGRVKVFPLEDCQPVSRGKKLLPVSSDI